MKGTKSVQEKTKRSAEDWVSVARTFGEKCVEIQQDSKLNIDQKLEKQRALGNEMTKEVQSDSHLSESDKRQMVDSINNYIDEWMSMHDIIQQNPNDEKTSKKKKK